MRKNCNITYLIIGLCILSFNFISASVYASDYTVSGVMTVQEHASGAYETMSGEFESHTEYGGNTKAAKIIKTEQQAPGVMVEHKDDGTKVVTINLSEVDEDSLPEKYEAKVILEAPVYTDNYAIKNKNELKDKVYFVRAIDVSESIDFDVSVDGTGNIFIFDPYMERIQKFNNEGKHVRNIGVKMDDDSVLKGDRWVSKSLKTQISASGGKVYVRDTKKNKIEALDESGKVLEVIDVPATIDGKDTRDMRMWADEEGVGVGQPSMNLRLRGDGRMKGEEEKDNLIKNIFKERRYIKEKKIKNANFLVIFADNKKIYTMIGLGVDKKGNEIYYLSTENGIISFKLSASGELRALINEERYWIKRHDLQCAPQALIENPQNSRMNDISGNIYLFQAICCEKNECVKKIRIVKISGMRVGE